MIKFLTIAGIVLASIILLLLIIIICILFCPIRYKIGGSNREELYAHLTISYLLSIIRFKVYYRDKMGWGSLRLFGIKIFDAKIPEIVEWIEKASDFLGSLGKKKGEDTNDSEEDTPPESGEDTVEGFISEEEAEKYLNEHDEIEDMNAIEKNISILSSIKEFVLNIKKKWYNFKEWINQKLKQWEKFKKELKFWYKVFQCPSLKPTLVMFKNIGIRVLKHVLPRKLRINLDYGDEDGYTMAKVSGYIFMAEGMLGKAINYIPHWDEQIFKIDGFIAGRVQIYVFLTSGWKIITNKHFIRMVRLFRKGLKRNGR